MTDENPIKRSQTKGPFRTHDEQGQQIVQVSFPASYKTYCYTAPDGVTLAVGDLVRVPGNQVNPEGSNALVRRLGSEYCGEIAQLVRKIERRSRGTEDRRAAPGAGDVVNNFPDRSRYEHDD